MNVTKLFSAIAFTGLVAGCMSVAPQQTIPGCDPICQSKTYNDSARIFMKQPELFHADEAAKKNPWRPMRTASGLRYAPQDYAIRAAFVDAGYAHYIRDLVQTKKPEDEFKMLQSLCAMNSDQRIVAAKAGTIINGNAAIGILLQKLQGADRLYRKIGNSRDETDACTVSFPTPTGERLEW